MFGSNLHQAQARFHAWMFEAALPLWATVGLDAPGLGFREHLDLDGRPAEVPFKRVRAQARQVYVFAHAHMLGFPGGIDVAAAGLRFIMQHARRADGGWVRTMGRDGGVLDPAADLYDTAFVLFACAWFARATGETAPLREARRTMEWVRAQMAAPGGGYHNAVPVEPGHRQQNPHMHLLEAVLALYEASGDAYYADVAHELVTLFHSHFHHRDTGTLGEFFDDMLAPAPDEAGTHVEPGHQYEWVWLLDQYGRLLGNAPEDEMRQLYRFAETHGRDDAGIAVLDAVGRDGAIRHGTSRLWPQTEALKAHAAMARRGMPVEQRIVDGISHLMDRHLSGCPTGTWQDQFGPLGGDNIATKIPASSLYHLFVAYAEVRDLLDR